MVAPVIGALGVGARLAYKPAIKLAKNLAKKYFQKGSNKKEIVKQVKDKGILEKFNNFKLKFDPKRPLKEVKPYGHTRAGKKPSLDVYEKTGAGVGRKKGGKVAPRDEGVSYGPEGTIMKGGKVITPRKARLKVSELGKKTTKRKKGGKVGLGSTFVASLYK